MVVAGTIAGALFAFAQLRRGSIGDAVVAHAVSNALVAVAVLGFGRWDLW
jgi:membrane protease YdiL (CAAX protease family)